MFCYVFLHYVIDIFHFYLRKVFKSAFIIWRPYVGVPPFLLTWLVVRRWNFFCLINTGQSQLGQFEVCTFTVFCDDQLNYVVGSNRSLKLSRPIWCVDYEMTILFLFLSVTFSDFSELQSDTFAVFLRFKMLLLHFFKLWAVILY